MPPEQPNSPPLAYARTPPPPSQLRVLVYGLAGVAALAFDLAALALCLFAVLRPLTSVIAFPTRAMVIVGLFSGIIGFLGLCLGVITWARGHRDARLAGAIAICAIPAAVSLLFLISGSARWLL